MAATSRRAQTVFVAKSAFHDLGKRFFRQRNRTAAANPIGSRIRKCGGWVAIHQRAGGLQDQPTETDDAHIRRTKVLRRSIGDRTLAVLNAGVLFGHPLDPGVAFSLLFGPVDQIIISRRRMGM
ncbi:MAG TPA: hypothetical protein VGC82_01300 [Rhodopila sp.]